MIIPTRLLRLLVLVLLALPPLLTYRSAGQRGEARKAFGKALRRRASWKNKNQPVPPRHVMAREVAETRDVMDPSYSQSCRERKTEHTHTMRRRKRDKTLVGTPCVFHQQENSMHTAGPSPQVFIN